ncbi:flagellin [Amaricoccus macauensis]|uniref:flagellin n=1 Tax=Amaricoccus macauensis TaxID=57001 RepID=UPI003C7D7614
MSSILTNSSAMVALQTLKGINNDLAGVQNEVSTGLKVSNSKDNAATWSIASTMKEDVAIFDKLVENLDKADAMVGVARSATEQVADLLIQAQEKVVQAAGATAEEQATLQTEIEALAATISSIALSSQFNGASLTNGTNGASQTVTMAVVRDASGTLATVDTMTIAMVDLEAVASALTGLAFDGSQADMDAVDAELDTVNAAAAAFGAAQARIETQSSYLSKQSDALTNGVSALVDADMEEASARLTALQTQQQLGTQALSIANQAPQAILSLFQ